MRASSDAARVTYYWPCPSGSADCWEEVSWEFTGDRLVGELRRRSMDTGEELPPVDIPLLRCGAIVR